MEIPKKEKKDSVIAFRTTKETFFKVKELAKQNDCSIGDVIQFLILKSYEGMREQLETKV